MLILTALVIGGKMQLEYDRQQNALRVTPGCWRSTPVTRENLPGVVDVVEGGRLLGVEISSVDDPDRQTDRFHRWLQDPLASDYVDISEDGSVYIQLSEQKSNDAVRSADTLITIELDAEHLITAVSFPRRAAGYEISYPSGNR